MSNSTPSSSSSKNTTQAPQASPPPPPPFAPSSREAALMVQSSEEYNPEVPPILPHEKIYSIQVGYRLYRLSGLSLSSDAPSYFTKFFQQPENEEKVLFFDRDPQIFEKIYNHLQGYSINIENDYIFMNLWLDCFYFGLKNLQKNLNKQDYFAIIGNEKFRIPKSLINMPGNSPNFFTINFDRLLIDNINVIEKNNMLRPPPQTFPQVSNRSSKLFADLLEFFRGNHLIIMNDDHRQLLIKEARYYRFLELEQRLIKFKITYRNEIVINLNDISRKGLQNPSTNYNIELSLTYYRPYIKDEMTRDLIFELNSKDFDCQSEIKLILNKSTKLPTLKVTNKACHKLHQVFKDYFSHVLKDDKELLFFVGFNNSKTFINGKEMNSNWVNDILGIKEVEKEAKEDANKRGNDKKRKLSENDDNNNESVESSEIDHPSPGSGEIIEICLSRSLWKVMMRGPLARLHAVTLEGFTRSNDTLIDFL
ncbi:BTB/POZ domain-containing protein, putative [Candida dubliniensis CD36]|uniref:BTB/POZ domain-containing protein, putative n=1 Tax=Candida dubliniensis (strain CD36 / ATCC MYA-646 / CBS 7987 / NCPF 3949 / NRRL Y-17841) TaxID=573826 RepID=B9WFV1_CANDC|nr:BTB/POZ domain-containing protein, putative [Candida dubliniensis CD36]CAX42120.1 BTB/POZ domain-containing protein, putative [Candida dubliniensis CD36]